MNGKALGTTGLNYVWQKIKSLLSGKADSATTLTGYNISDAYTKTEVDNMVASAGGGGCVVSATAPTDTSLIWIDSSASNTPKYYDSTLATPAWVTVKAVWG